MTAPAHVDAGRTELAAQRKAARFAETLEGRVLAAVVAAGEKGLTALEAREALGLPVEKQYSVSPRLSALKGKKLVEPTAMVRDHFQAYVATPAGRGDQPGHPFAAILDGTVDTRPEPARRTPEHLRTDDMPSYLRQKGELA